MAENVPTDAFGADQEPFAGIPSFMRLPVTRELEGVDVAIVGIPYDSGTSYRSGARFGPRKVRESSLMLWGYNQALKVAPTQTLSVVDYGDVAVVPVSIDSTLQVITDEVSALLDQGLTVGALGGDHSVSLPLLRAHAQKFGPLSVIHFDSHPDTWDAEYPGHPYSHGTPFVRGSMSESSIAETPPKGSTTLAGPPAAPSHGATSSSKAAAWLRWCRPFPIGVSARRCFHLPRAAPPTAFACVSSPAIRCTSLHTCSAHGGVRTGMKTSSISSPRT